MNKLIFLISLLCATNVFASEITVKVQGMVCSMCAQGIKKKFTQLDEVKEINVNLDSKLVKIITKENKEIGNGLIKKIITEAGYNVSTIERK